MRHYLSNGRVEKRPHFQKKKKVVVEALSPRVGVVDRST